MLKKIIGKQHKTSIILVLVTIALYFFFGYKLVRTEYTKLIFLYVSLFALFGYFITKEKYNFKFLVVISFLFRIIFLLAIPNLSQDFYRFIWDGRMILEGFNPYLSIPEYFINNNVYPINQAQELYNGMGNLNGSHYTNYPPINQLCFAIAGFFANKSIVGSVLVMRLLIILADVGILYVGKKLLQQLKLPIHHIFWYLLNPFIIIELTGNLHFESVMIFFLVWSIYLLHIGHWKVSAVLLAASVSVKLIPLIFLPLFYQWFIKKEGTFTVKFTNLITFYTIVIVVTLLLFLPFYNSALISNYSNSVGLWFQNFEFNASIYYIFREIGYLFRGWNEIAIIGKILPVLVLIFVLITSFFKKNRTTKDLIVSMLFVLSFYYLTTTTVHPWYLATLLILSIFTSYKFPLVWSFIIILSYLAYANTSNTENLWIIGIEYLVVYSVLCWEMFVRNKSLSKISNSL